MIFNDIIADLRNYTAFYMPYFDRIFSKWAQLCHAEFIASSGSCAHHQISAGK